MAKSAGNMRRSAAVGHQGLAHTGEVEHVQLSLLQELIQGVFTMRRRRYVSLASVTGGAALAGILGLGVGPGRPIGPAGQATAQEPAAEAGVVALDQLSSTFRSVASRLQPSVVAIQASSRAPQSAQLGVPDDLFGGLPPEIREQLLGQLRERGGGGGRSPAGIGSGVIIRSDGYILTNNHVVEGADTLEVLLADERVVEGKIVGTDPKTDLAVIKIDEDNLQAANLGDSTKMQVGDWVLAIGAPFGLEQTVTAGIISAKNRVRAMIDNGDGYEDFLQTDASINPGNSGGPLVNLRGDVIGINTAIASRSGGDDGVGFAVPSRIAKPIADSIIRFGKVKRGLLGARVGNVPKELLDPNSKQNLRGAYIDGVVDDQPAARAGLQPGDVVTAINGSPIRSGTQLRNTVATTLPGETIVMDVVRGDESLQLTLQLGELTDELLAQSGGASQQTSELGITGEALTEETAQQLGLNPEETGVLVTGVADGSLADRAQIKPGDLIQAVSNRPVSTPEELDAVLKETLQAGRGAMIQLRSGNMRRGVIIR
jgi:serine protease Do